MNENSEEDYSGRKEAQTTFPFTIAHTTMHTKVG